MCFLDNIMLAACINTVLTQTLIFGNTSFNSSDNSKNLYDANKFFYSMTKIFDEPLIQTTKVYFC